jgi:hypothetical protein
MEKQPSVSRVIVRKTSARSKKDNGGYASV